MRQLFQTWLFGKQSSQPLGSVQLLLKATIVAIVMAFVMLLVTAVVYFVVVTVRTL